MKLSLSVVLAALALIASVGCASREPTDADEAPSTEEDLSTSCTNPRRYLVVGGRECSDVAGNRGRWIASPAFADAPVDGGCLYAWSGEKYARIDRDAFRESLRWPAMATAACGAKQAAAAELVEIPEIHDDDRGVGSIGCDVCGMQRDGKIWVVLPPEVISYHELQVKLSSGAVRSFRIDGADTARQVSFTLPPPPAGASYVNGRVRVQ